MKPILARIFFRLIALLLIAFNLTSCITFEPDIAPLEINVGENLNELPETGGAGEANPPFESKEEEEKLLKEAKSYMTKGWFECEEHFQWNIKLEAAKLKEVGPRCVDSVGCNIGRPLREFFYWYLGGAYDIWKVSNPEPQC